MQRIVLGILAHVDAGKTTLSEGLLYTAGGLHKLGRVDHGDAFLDTEAMERERGITIFSKQAVFSCGETEFVLLDTPGHTDFSAEMERTLPVLDYALLVISGTDGIQSHTRTLWQLLERYGVPTFLFFNKMDLAGCERESLLAELEAFGTGFVDFSGERDARDENIALCDETVLERYLETASLETEDIRRLIVRRKLFPCFFGSALKLEGVRELLEALQHDTQMPDYPAAFRARVFKISRDAQGTRLTHLKVTGGQLRAKTQLECGKADQLRLYSGAKFRPLDCAEAGSIVAVTGLEESYPGQGLGGEPEAEQPMLQPVLSYRLLLPDGVDAHTVLPRLRQLEEEDPLLRIVWEPAKREISVQLMGQIQLEILQRQIADRFGLAVQFGTGSIVYRETIADTVEGVGHFEPLRHYAEVHLLLEPAPRGSGLHFATACSADVLDLNWQRLILTHLQERVHRGVLSGSPITDMKLTLLTGRAHAKHTEGGDFRQATYRAIRQGLMQAQSILLEPYYDFRLELPAACIGRAMTELQAMGATLDPPETEGSAAVLTGFAPVAELREYGQSVASYTHGLGRLHCTLHGYEPCREQERIVAASGYQAEQDAENPSSSVFCRNGAGVSVPWQEVKAWMHVESPLRQEREAQSVAPTPPQRTGYGGRSAVQDAELLEIFEKTYGKVTHEAFTPKKPPARTTLDERYSIRPAEKSTDYLLVDGYNMIFAWDGLKALAEEDLSAARETLVELLAEYRAVRGCELIVVFDAYRVKGGIGSVEKRQGISIVYTKEAQTADSFIERATYDLREAHSVRVATSDHLEQLIILGHGALRISARSFLAEVQETSVQLERMLAKHNANNAPQNSVARRAKLQSAEKE